MLQLLSNFSIPQIIIFIILLALAIKEGISLFLWFKDLVTKRDDKRDSNLESIKQNRKELNNLKECVDTMSQSINQISNKVDLLIASDRDDIKSDLTKDHHHFCYQQGWIDDYSLDCMERRYQHYVDERGNSFIEHLMKEVRELPKTPPDDSQGEL